MKKIKLILSICLMCLSVAVLCMGILAANSATYNITGNISYNMIDGVALVNTRVYKVAGTTTETDLSTKCTELSSKSFEEIERDTSTYYILSQKLDSQPLINTSDKTYSSKEASVKIVYGAVDSGVAYYTYYIVIEIRNVSADTGYVLNAYLETVTTPTKSSVIVNAEKSSAISIASDEYKNVIVALTYTGTSTDKDEDSFSYTLKVSYEEISWPLALNCDSTNQYWYVELGQASSSDTKKLRWRLISLDGTTKYDYSATKPTYQSGAIFLQESTLLNGTSYRYNYYNDSYDECDNWYKADIRTYVNAPSNYILTTDDMATYVKPRTIVGIEIYDSEEGTYKYTNESDNSSGITTDYFWFLSSQEINKFLGSDNTSRIWKPYNYTSAIDWWCRTPYDKSTKYMYYVNAKGVFSSNYSSLYDDDFGYPASVRAAFQLA